MNQTISSIGRLCHLAAHAAVLDIESVLEWSRAPSLSVLLVLVSVPALFDLVRGVVAVLAALRKRSR